MGDLSELRSACLYLPMLPDDVTRDELLHACAAQFRDRIAFIHVKPKDVIAKVTATHGYLNFFTIMDAEEFMEYYQVNTFRVRLYDVNILWGTRPPPSTLYIGQFSGTINKNKLLEDLGVYGIIESIEVKYKYNYFAQVVFQSAVDAQFAQRYGHGTSFPPLKKAFISYHVPTPEQYKCWLRSKNIIKTVSSQSGESGGASGAGAVQRAGATGTSGGVSGSVNQGSGFRVLAYPTKQFSSSSEVQSSSSQSSPPSSPSPPSPPSSPSGSHQVEQVSVNQDEESSVESDEEDGLPENSTYLQSSVLLLSTMNVHCEMTLDTRTAYLQFATEADPRARADCIAQLRAIGEHAKKAYDDQINALETFVAALPPLQPQVRTLEDFKCISCKQQYRCCRSTRCAHVCVCESCAHMVLKSTKKCPVCNVDFKEYEKVIV